MKPINGIKVFRMDDCMWYAGNSLKEVTEFMLNESGLTQEDITDDDPYELSDLQMLETMYVEHELTDTCEPITFKEALEKMIEKGVSFPCVFASTEY